jgi:hypothetical protein
MNHLSLPDVDLRQLSAIKAASDLADLSPGLASAGDRVPSSREVAEATRATYHRGGYIKALADIAVLLTTHGAITRDDLRALAAAEGVNA